MIICSEFIRLFPRVYYDHNNLTEHIKSGDEEIDDEITMEESYQDLINILKENPTITIEIKAYRAVDERNNFSMVRARQSKNRLIAMGIAEQRLITRDGGIIKENTINDNEYLTFKVLNFDYESK